MEKKSGFKLKSGNSPMFKQLGSSPMEFEFGGEKYGSFGEYMGGIRKIKVEDDDGLINKRATRKARRQQIGKHFQASKFRQTLGKLFPNPLSLFSK